MIENYIVPDLDDDTSLFFSNIREEYVTSSYTISRLIKVARCSDEILNIVDEHYQFFDISHCIFALQRYASLLSCHRWGQQSKDRVQILFNEFIEKLYETISRKNRLKPTQITASLWACAKLGLYHYGAFRYLTKEVLERASELRPVAISMAIWAVAKANHKDDSFFYSIQDEVIVQCPKMEAQQLSNVAWAYAVSGGNVGPVLWNGIIGRASQLMDTFHPINISMLLFSFAFARVICPTEVLTDLKQLGMSMLSRFAARGLANFAWSIRELGVATEDDLISLANEAMFKLIFLPPDCFDTLVNAFNEEVPKRVKSDKILKDVQKTVPIGSGPSLLGRQNQEIFTNDTLDKGETSNNLKNIKDHPSVILLMKLIVQEMIMRVEEFSIYDLKKNVPTMQKLEYLSEEDYFSLDEININSVIIPPLYSSYRESSIYNIKSYIFGRVHYLWLQACRWCDDTPVTALLVLIIFLCLLCLQ
eukprot:GHVL01006851.1.p1 GENE.GHVL01006851.1~~GHVL01006851.1.p1  ORF type:complete len:476 (+),score=72.48 GHVL01006851.1:161-1588(+)